MLHVHCCFAFVFPMREFNFQLFANHLLHVHCCIAFVFFCCFEHVIQIVVFFACFHCIFSQPHDTRNFDNHCGHVRSWPCWVGQFAFREWAQAAADAIEINGLEGSSAAAVDSVSRCHSLHTDVLFLQWGMSCSRSQWSLRLRPTISTHRGKF